MMNATTPTVPRGTRRKANGERAPAATPAAAKDGRPMEHRRGTIAKLARPSGRELVRRERLFAALDAARSGRIVWVSAPCGAGKTSLVASWIEARRIPCLWLSLDPGDADPASLFYYLAAAARSLGVSDLPAFSASSGPQLDVFARRFGERLFAAVPDGLVLLLDGYDVLPGDAPVHSAVDALFEAVPPGSLAVVTSRAAPPPQLARWVASAGLRALDWPELRLTLDEGAALRGPGVGRMCGGRHP
jgi:ATP/maltotriose-dependent transcriptional regulator MalT